MAHSRGVESGVPTAIPAQLPEDPAALKQLVADLGAALDEKVAALDAERAEKERVAQELGAAVLVRARTG